MANVTIDLSGDAALLAELSALPGKLQRKAFRTASRRAGKIYAEAAKARAPVDTGQLRRSIKVRALKRSRTAVGVTVGTSKKDYTGDQFYAAFIEYGHKLGKRKRGGNAGDSDNRKQVPAKPFMRPAFDASAAQLQQVFISEIGNQLESIRAKGK